MASDEEVRAVFPAVAGEVPGSPIFAMKLAPQSRHLEVSLRLAIVLILAWLHAAMMGDAGCYEGLFVEG